MRFLFVVLAGIKDKYYLLTLNGTLKETIFVWTPSPSGTEEARERPREAMLMRQEGHPRPSPRGPRRTSLRMPAHDAIRQLNAARPLAGAAP